MMGEQEKKENLPMGWEKTTVGDVTLKAEKIAPHSEPERTISYIDISSIDNAKNIVRDAKSFRLADAPSRARQIVFAGDVLFATVRPYLRNIAAVPSIYEGEIASTGFSVLRPSIGIEPKFLYFTSTSSDFVNSLSGKQYGVSYPAVKDTQVREQLILLPPLNEQKRIVAKIEELFSELDKGVECLKKAREQLKIYRQAVLKHAFEGKLTANWREETSVTPWRKTTLGEQLSFLTSGSRGWAKFYADKGEVFIRAQNLKYDRLDLEDVAFVQLPDKSEGKRTLVQSGDLLITITGANVTKTAFVLDNIGTAYVSQHVALARPVEGSNTEFLHWFLIAESAGRKQLNKLAYGAGKPGLNLDNIRSVEINLPGPIEQAEIVSRISALLSIENNVSCQIEEQLKKSEALRQSILKKAFSGQLMPQDPSDEPASALLERIRDEKSAKTKAKAKPKKKTKNRKSAA